MNGKVLFTGVVWPKNTIFTELGTLQLFPVPKTEKNHERMAFCHTWRDQDHIAERAEGHTKILIPEMLQGLEKVMAQVHYI